MCPEQGRHLATCGEKEVFSRLFSRDRKWATQQKNSNSKKQEEIRASEKSFLFLVSTFKDIGRMTVIPNVALT